MKLDTEVRESLDNYLLANFKLDIGKRPVSFLKVLTCFHCCRHLVNFQGTEGVEEVVDRIVVAADLGEARIMEEDMAIMEGAAVEECQIVTTRACPCVLLMLGGRYLKPKPSSRMKD